MERLYKEYGDKVDFLIVYIREAHPEMLPEGNEVGVVGRPKNINERVILATECATKYQFTIPMVIDYIEGHVAGMYEARTVRTTICDRDGRVAYYAGRGPWGFKISEIERALKKIVANDGYMPPPPELTWGELEDGLACGISVDPEQFHLGENVLVTVEFKNTMDVPVALPLDPKRVRASLVFENDEGDILSLEEASGSGSPGRRRSRLRPTVIEPGASHAVEVEGALAAVLGVSTSPGEYRARLDLELYEDSLAGVEQDEDDEPLWMGHLRSGGFSFGVVPTPEMSCVTCHGGDDFHHLETAPRCNVCHSGEEDTEDFGLLASACESCHPREGERGRRQILGEGGEFQLASRHCGGEPTDERCKSCHDHSRHGDGLVDLLDPHSGEKEPWEGSSAGFCLACHGRNPPAGVVFPEPTGSGYDKSGFPDTEVARQGITCRDCHSPHGSAYTSLLRISSLDSPHR